MIAESGILSPATPDRIAVELAGVRISALIVHPVAPAAAQLPPVIAVHGFGSSAEHTWGLTGHLRELSRAGRLVIAPDLPGHGHSAKSHRPGDYSMELFTEVVAGIGAALGHSCDRYDLLGYSLGSRVCVEAAGRAGDGTPRWRRAVLGGYDGRPLFDGVDIRQLEAVLRGELWEPSKSAPAASSGQTLRVAAIAAAVPGNDPAALLALIAGLALPAAAALPPLPVLLVVGDADPLADRAASLAGAVPAGSVPTELIVVPGRDHISTVPAKVFRAAAARFLGTPG